MRGWLAGGGATGGREDEECDDDRSHGVSGWSGIGGGVEGGAAESNGKLVNGTGQRIAPSLICTSAVQARYRVS